MKILKNTLIYIFFIGILIGMFFIARINYPSTLSGYKNSLQKVKITEITDSYIDISDNDDIETHSVQTTTYFSGILLNGKNKGKNINGYQIVIDSAITPSDFIVKKGDIVYLDTTVTGSNESYQFVEYNRTNTPIVLFIILALGLIIFGAIKGLKTLLTLVLTCVSIFTIFLPSIFSGQNIAVWAWVITIYITLSTLIILNGFSKKTLCMIIGCLGGALATWLLSKICIYTLQLTGYTSLEITYLLQITPNMNLTSIVAAGILIGSTGAIMDVAVDISSSLHELYLKAKDNSKKSLIKSGFNIGKDIMGTMSNTLIMAYIGGSIITILSLMSYNFDFTYLVSLEAISIEILQMLVGSIGILLTIPITVMTCAIIYNKKKTK